MFVLLTFSRLLISRQKVRAFPHCPCLSCSLFLAFSSLARSECVLFPHHPCLSCSLFLAFLSLGNCKTIHSFH
ncbi:hypothetical protein B0H14DRAFT_2817133 [Mycena olivaceomarginata]|nr:hypothetical protein B0H14DRAFT_2817133 [Mycena olivaceomarginata]